MIFYNDPFIAKLAEEHAAATTKLNDEQTDRVMDSYSRVRSKLRDRLDAMSNTNTFTAQKSRSILMQLDSALKKMGENLNDDMADSAQDMSEMAIQHLVDELSEWDDYFAGTAAPLNIDINAEATDVSKLLVNNYEASLQLWNAQQRSVFAQSLTDGVIGGSTTDEVVRDIAQQMLAKEWMLRRVVRTELQGIYSRAKLNVMGDLVDDDTVPDLLKTVWNPMDSRTAEDSKYVQKMVDAHNDGLIVPVDEYFHYKWKGVEREYMAPPDRPNDRSIMVPYRKYWDKKYEG